jgi:hypothetical protein
MSGAGLDAIRFSDGAAKVDLVVDSQLEKGSSNEPKSGTVRAAVKGPRRTPRQSLIVVLPENHTISPEMVTEHLPAKGQDEAVDVILACAGQPHNIAFLQRRIRDMQILLAPAGTSTEELRELAMQQAPGDIITLRSGTPVSL